MRTLLDVLNGVIFYQKKYRKILEKSYPFLKKFTAPNLFIHACRQAPPVFIGGDAC
uniref:Uncharacterized protein n=1 Tax=Oryza brachyantha TaxID=4533 RepID=J3LBX0_ORYBR